MGRKRPEAPKPGKPPAVSGEATPWGLAAVAACAAMLIGLALYGPALHAPFFFDDVGLNIRLPERDASFLHALVGRRPVLAATYWLDYQWTGDEPFGYHVMNLAVHAINTALVLLVLLRLLAFAGWEPRKRRTAALAGAGIFLVHPLQTEAVAYIAGRAESLCALFMLLAYAVFLYRPKGAISWARAAAVLCLAGLAVGAKENGVAIGGAVVLTDLFWGPDAGRKAVFANWRLYLPAAALGAVAAVEVGRILAVSESAGFEATGLKWYHYLLTEARAIFTYLRMTIVPAGQSVDHDFPVSRTPFEHGAIAYVLLLTGLIGLAWFGRRRAPLAGFGVLLWLVLLAPTSSVVPIADPLVERRMYLPLAGLILAGCEAAGRWKPRATAGVVAASAALLAALTWQRNELWGNPEQMWRATARLSPHKSRPHLYVSELLVAENRCGEALAYLKESERLMPEDGMVQVGIARALDCLGRRDEALERLRHAARVQPSTRVYQWLGLLEGATGHSAEAGAALKKAVELGPRNPDAHSALGLWYESVGDRAAAMQQYGETLVINQDHAEARAGFARVTGSPR